MPLIKCSCCGASVSDMAYVCPYCGLDVVALQNSGRHCYNCEYHIDYDGDKCELGPAGYPCLMWTEKDYDY